MKQYLLLLLVVSIAACCRPTRPAVDIWTAASSGEAGLLQQHVQAGSDLDQPHQLTGSTPLNMAISRGHVAGARVLIEGGANIEARNADGGTPIIVAAFFGHEPIVRMLIHAGANVDATNNMGFTALQIVDGDWSPQVVKIYKFMEKLMRIDLDLDAIRDSRAGIAAILRVAGEE